MVKFLKIFPIFSLLFVNNSSFERDGIEFYGSKGCKLIIFGFYIHYSLFSYSHIKKKSQSLDCKEVNIERV